MKKFLNKRFLPIFLAFVMCISTLSVPAFASFSDTVVVGPSGIPLESFFSIELMQREIERFRTNTSDSCAYISSLAYLQNRNNWAEVSKSDLSVLATYWNLNFKDEFSITASVSSTSLEDGTEVYFVRMHLLNSVYTGRGSVQWCLNNGSYQVLAATDEVSETDGQWIPEYNRGTTYHMLSRESLTNLATSVGGDVIRLGNYYFLYSSDRYRCYADTSGLPFAAFYNDNSWASNQPRPDTTVKDEDGNDVDEELPEDNQTNIDFSGMTITLPNGNIMVADQIIYDESTKTYHIDSHDTYNTYNTYYYEWNYYINYTSITYIGQSEEYNKYYEVYYELPDGRDSADLTAEELEQLNLTIDVIPYGRSADDVSLRSLYHFDGDTHDSSYWNYCTDFTWNTGASLTYLESGNFDGCLYLDETDHDFTVTLPSDIETGDFDFRFRYYQSSTLAPQTDSYIRLGTTTVLQFNGASMLNASGTSLSVMPVGSWNEIALTRSSGTLYYYLNGVCVGNVSDANAYSAFINFHFGSSQQTYKYLDELRFVNQALVNPPANYEPTSVPYDTNLTLVLPDSQAPVADEYWSITSSHENLIDGDFTTGVLPDGWLSSISSIEFYYNQSSPAFVPSFGLYYNALRPAYNPSGQMFSNFFRLTTGAYHSRYNPTIDYTDGLLFPLSVVRSSSYNGLSTGSYTLSVVLMDGSVYSLPFTLTSGSNSTPSLSFPGGVMGFFYFADPDSSSRSNFLYLCPSAFGASLDIRYIELTSGTSTDLSAEWVTSIVGLDPSQMNTPTLAVRTDVNITSYQIGGVRPSLPTKGQVWAMVESSYITSIQIYNGQAWEACDGRIWTGERWIPARSYNVVTLQDMYDVVDATDNYEYIYTESGFWSWWQKSWNAFTEKLFAALSSVGSSGGSGGSGGSSDTNVDVDLNGDITVEVENENDASFWQFVVLVIAGGRSVIRGARHLFGGVVSNIPDSVDAFSYSFDSGGAAVGAFDGTSSDPDNPTVQVLTPDHDITETEVDPWRYR